MSFFSTTVSGYDGISAEYRPSYEAHQRQIPATVFVRLDGADSYLCLSIEDARALSAQLPGVLAEHQAAEQVSAGPSEFKAA
jgi:hypothetical protein